MQGRSILFVGGCYAGGMIACVPGKTHSKQLETRANIDLE
jgi:hypothetical protein